MVDQLLTFGTYYLHIFVSSLYFYYSVSLSECRCSFKSSRLSLCQSSLDAAQENEILGFKVVYTEPELGRALDP